MLPYGSIADNKNVGDIKMCTYIGVSDIERCMYVYTYVLCTQPM